MANKLKTAFDFDGVASEGLYEKGGIIITGRSASENDEILEILKDKTDKKVEIFNYEDDGETDENNRDVKIGIWKAKKIKSLGIEKFYEDTESQIQIIKELNPNLEIIKVIDGVPSEKMNFIVFYHSNTPIIPIAQKLEKEGNRVILAVIEDSSKILLPEEENKPEDKVEKARRLAIGDGLIDKYPADDVLKMAKRIKDKKNWFVLTDSNSNYQYATKMAEMGFTRGFFPTEADRRYESDRKLAKDFVKENYPDIKVAEVKSFKEVAEGIEFLNQSEDMWVLKSVGDAGCTVCPNTEDYEIARDELISALEEMKTDYETDGFILEPRIIDPIELTPQSIWVDGVQVFTDMDIEVKAISAGSAVQTGCVNMLNVKTDFEDRINKIAFPQVIHDMAKERKGCFVWDLSILIDKKGTMWFGEFCSMRMGFDSFNVELTQSADDEGSKVATPFFSSLIHKKNPLRKKYGVGVRLLNIGHGGKMVEDSVVEVSDEAVACTYLFEVKLKEGKMVSTKYCFDFAVVTSACDELYETIDKCYEYVDMVMFEGKYFRPKFDYYSHDYTASIMKRLDYAISYGLISLDNEEVEQLSTPSRIN